MKYLLHLFSIFILLSVIGCSDETIHRTDSPVTRKKAMEKVDLALPSSASSIYYMNWYTGGMQGLERYTRFDVDPEELDAAVEAIIFKNNTTMSRSLAYPKSPLSSSRLSSPSDRFSPATWWNPGTVTRGYYRGHMDAYALQILVDLDNSRIYISESD